MGKMPKIDDKNLICLYFIPRFPENAKKEESDSFEVSSVKFQIIQENQSVYIFINLSSFYKRLAELYVKELSIKDIRKADTNRKECKDPIYFQEFISSRINYCR